MAARVDAPPAHAMLAVERAAQHMRRAPANSQTCVSFVTLPRTSIASERLNKRTLGEPALRG